MLVFTKHLVALCLASTTAVSLGNNYDFPGPGGDAPFGDTPFNIMVGESMEICDLDLEVSLSTTGGAWVSDVAMDFQLTSPGGNQLEISVLRFSINQNACSLGGSLYMLEVTFDDESPNPNNEACSHDTVQPLDPLSTFDGATTNGQWTLEVKNSWGNIVNLNSWVIHITECVSFCLFSCCAFCLYNRDQLDSI